MKTNNLFVRIMWTLIVTTIVTGMAGAILTGPSAHRHDTSAVWAEVTVLIAAYLLAFGMIWTYDA